MITWLLITESIKRKELKSIWKISLIGPFFAVKFGPDGEIRLFKTRFVAKNFSEFFRKMWALCGEKSFFHRYSPLILHYFFQTSIRVGKLFKNKSFLIVIVLSQKNQRFEYIVVNNREHQQKWAEKAVESFSKFFISKFFHL